MFGDNFFEDGQYLGNRAIKTVRDYVDRPSYERLRRYYENIDRPRRENPPPDRSEINGWMSLCMKQIGLLKIITISLIR